MHNDLKKQLEERVGCPLFIGNGWLHLIQIYDAAVRKHFPDYKLAQVKEKFGSLRIYIDDLGEPVEGLSEEDASEKVEEIRQLEDELEGQSTKICEICGRPGVTRSAGWITTLCEVHFQAL